MIKKVFEIAAVKIENSLSDINFRKNDEPLYEELKSMCLEAYGEDDYLKEFCLLCQKISELVEVYFND